MLSSKIYGRKNTISHQELNLEETFCVIRVSFYYTTKLLFYHLQKKAQSYEMNSIKIFGNNHSSIVSAFY